MFENCLFFKKQIAKQTLIPFYYAFLPNVFFTWLGCYCFSTITFFVIILPSCLMATK